MNEKTYNLTSKKLNIICNHCGSLVHIKKDEEVRCKYCGEAIDLSIAYNDDVRIQSESYYIYQLKAAIINDDEELKKQAIDNLTLLESKNDIFLHIMRRKALKNVADKRDLDFIIEYLIIQNKEYSLEDKKKQIKKCDYKDEYLKRLEDNSEDQELFNNLYEVKEELKSYDKIVDNSYKFGILFSSIGLIISILILFLSKVLFKEEIVFASTIVISVLPSILFSLSVIKFINIKKTFINIIIFIALLVVIFIILSFLLSLRYNIGSENGIINNYIYHLKNCLSEINEAINSAFGGSND